MLARQAPPVRVPRVVVLVILLAFAGASTVDAQPILYAKPVQVLAAPVATACPLMAGSGGGPTVSMTGDTLAVGWPALTRLTDQCGIVDVYRRDGTQWVLEQRIDVGHDGDLRRGAMAVALSGDTLAVGATRSYDYVSPPVTGAVYVYRRQNGTWAEEATITPPRVMGEVWDQGFGASVALDVDRLLVGDPSRAQSPPTPMERFDWISDSGAVFFFVRDQGQWRLEQQIGPGTGYWYPEMGPRPLNGSFGAAVALDGGQALVGNPTTQRETGEATPFRREVAGWVAQPAANTTLGYRRGIGSAVAVQGQRGIAGASGHTYAFDGANWSVVDMPNGTSARCGLGASVRAAAFGGPGPHAQPLVAVSCGLILLDEFPVGTTPGMAVLVALDGQQGTANYFGGSVALVGRVLAVGNGSVYLFDVDDLDGDGLPLDWEIAQGLSPWSAAGSDGATGDPDGDGVTNAAERAAGTFARIPNTWLFAEGATGFFDTRVALVNAEAVTATTTVRLLFEDSTSESKTLTIEGGHRDTVDVSTWLAGRAVPFSIEVVSSPDAVVAERTMAWPAATRASAHTGAGVPAARTSWYFAEGDARAFDTYLLVANPQASPVTVTATFLLDDGTTFSRGYDVGARARLTLYLDAVEGLRGHSFATTLVGSAAVVAERAMYLDAVGERWKIGHVAAGAAAPATAWYVAEGTTRAPFDEYLLLANPGEATRATVTFLLPQDAPVVVPYDLAAHSRTTIAVNDVPGVAETDVSIAVAADHPIVVERAMYWPRAYPAWYEGHVVGGVTAAGTRWVLAEGESGGAAGVESYVLVANPSASDAHLRVRVLRTGDHAPIVFERVVASQTRLTLAMSEVGLEAGETFGVDVESLDGTPIVVERAMYWNAAGRTWSAGTAEAGLRLR